MKNNNLITADMLEQARTWYVRLGSEAATGKDWESFTVWLEANSLHVDAYDQVELTLADISPVTETPNISDNVVSLDAKRRNLKPSIFVRYAAIAAVFIAALSLFATTNTFQSAPQIQQYATNIGGFKDITLSDGTQISLNTNTKIRVQMDKKTRTITLDSGEAYFEIAKDNSRPFIINAMGSTITDIGTAFSVYASDKALQVSVAEGIVDIQSYDQIVRLTKGRKAVQKRGSKTLVVMSVDTDTISTWRDSVLVFEDVPLSAIVPELNRYFKTPIVLADETVSDMTFSGVLNISDQGKMLASVEALMPITSTTQNGRILLSGEQ
jgi:transmembrane sensor